MTGAERQPHFKLDRIVQIAFKARIDNTVTPEFHSYIMDFLTPEESDLYLQLVGEYFKDNPFYPTGNTEGSKKNGS